MSDQPTSRRSARRPDRTAVRASTGRTTPPSREGLWQAQAAAWRDPARVVAFPGTESPLDPRSLKSVAHGYWWEVLQELDVTLLVSREYENLLVSLSNHDGVPRSGFLQVPHPSGIAYDPTSSSVHVACTRNPNQVLELVPARAFLDRTDVTVPSDRESPLVPHLSRYYPGSLYLHDLAMIGEELYGNAVGHNCIVRLPRSGGFDRVWWPTAIETPLGPDYSCNYLQLNSIAGATTLAESWFSASASRMSSRRPGHLNFPVDGRGVLFRGDSGNPIHAGLTRPHSARLHQGSVWVDNSGYGELRRYRGDEAEVVATLPGWTRGLAMCGGVAIVGTSRVIPRFSRYAPGLDVGSSICALHALDLLTGEVLGSLDWPFGNQIFAIEILPRGFTDGLPGRVLASRKGFAMESATPEFYYSFSVGGVT